MHSGLGATGSCSHDWRGQVRTPLCTHAMSQEALVLGWGGTRSIRQVLSGCDWPTGSGSQVDRQSPDLGRREGGMRGRFLCLENRLRIPSPGSPSDRDASDLVATHTHALLPRYLLKSRTRSCNFPHADTSSDCIPSLCSVTGGPREGRRASSCTKRVLDPRTKVC